MFNKNITIGILGGGQLGKMTLDVANKWGLKVNILDADINCPSSKFCNNFIQGDLMDYNSVMNFGNDVDIITIEIENVNVQALKDLEKKGKIVFPQPGIIETIQDKSLQKKFYLENEIPTSSFQIFKNITELKSFIISNKISFPFIWKASKMGYDGFGVKKVSNIEEVNQLKDCHCIIEELVDIKKELAVMVISSKSGEIKNYHTVEMEFNKNSNQVEYILSPANISEKLSLEAENLAVDLAKKLKIVGLLAVEMFLNSEGEILVNEVAPRPHNSYHFSIEGSYTSQFEQLLRSILGIPLGSTKTIQNSVMVNLVGDDGYSGPASYNHFDQIIGIEGVNPHIYGKFETRPNRKMGHVTIINRDLNKAKEIAKKIKETVTINSKK
ncbi:MAG: 5-(carboxyamino)imidazole ribonucleotide synthase [Bacteroidota bacterium]